MFGGLIKRARQIRSAYSVMRKVAQHPLHRRNRFKAVVRWIRMQTGIILAPNHQITIPYVSGSRLSWPVEATSVQNCARYGLGEYADMAFCLHMLRPGDLFCDVGANAGVYTVLAAHAVGCSVVAAEPIPRTFDLLMQNVYLNGLSKRVDSRNVGVGRESGTLNFTSSLWSFNHVVDGADEDTVEVQVHPLDVILGGRVPALIKIDVEGFEAEVLVGAKKTLTDPSIHAVLLEMTRHVERYGATLNGITETLHGNGFFGPYWYSPETRSIIAVGKPAATKYNQIFLRSKDIVSKRLVNAPCYEIHGVFV